MDVEIVKEGEEAKTIGPSRSDAKGQPDLFSATYRIGRSRVTDEELDKYVSRRLIKASLRGLCHASRYEEVCGRTNKIIWPMCTCHYPKDL